MQKDLLYRKLNIIHYYLGLLLVFWFPLDDHFIPFLSFLWVLSGVIHLRPGMLKGAEIRWSYVLLFVLFYLLHLISVAYSANSSAAWFELEIKLPLLFFPLLAAALMVFSQGKRKENIFLAFISGTFLASLICLGLAFWGNESFNPANFTYQNLSHFLHPSYFSMHLTFALAILLFYFLPRIKQSNSFKLLLTITGIIAAVVFVLLLSSRAGIIAALLIIIMKIIQVIIRLHWSWLMKSLILLGSIALLFGIITTNSRVKNMLKGMPEFFSLSEQKFDREDLNSSQMRVIVWKSGLKILKDHGVFGVGNGDVKDELARQVKSHYLKDQSQEFNYNAHNQFLDTFIALGLPGFLVLLSIILWPGIVAIRERNWLLLALVIILFVNLFFESMINRQAGVVFLSFFLPFMFGYKEK